MDHSKVDSAPVSYWAPLDREHTVIVDDGGDPAALRVFGDSVLVVPTGRD
ncbi:hypothetical protein [Amycolatopsis marina]|nr:hypothetical protein [Amycolatopsis marina]